MSFIAGKFNIFFYSAVVILSIEIILNPFNEISSTVLVSYPLLLFAAYILFRSQKIQYTDSDIDEKPGTELWDHKKEDLIDYYNDEENIDYSFKECLEGFYKDSSTNNRIKKILSNYNETQKPFKINLKRPAEDRFGFKLTDYD